MRSGKLIASLLVSHFLIALAAVLALSMAGSYIVRDS